VEEGIGKREERRKETTEPEAIGESAEKVVEKEEERKKKKEIRAKVADSIGGNEFKMAGAAARSPSKMAPGR